MGDKTKGGSSSSGRGRGRPPTYVWDGDEELSQSMENLKNAIERRRERQRENYHRKKKEKQQQRAKEQKDKSEKEPAKEQGVVDGAELLDYALSGSKSDSVKWSQQR